MENIDLDSESDSEAREDDKLIEEVNDTTWCCLSWIHLWFGF
jgi:hypothetical protein